MEAPTTFQVESSGLLGEGDVTGSECVVMQGTMRPGRPAVIWLTAPQSSAAPCRRPTPRSRAEAASPGPPGGWSGTGGVCVLSRLLLPGAPPRGGSLASAGTSALLYPLPLPVSVRAAGGLNF